MKPPAEFKVMRVRECPTPSMLIQDPESAVRYWREHIPKADWFDPCKECFVVLVLNTRDRILGHNLVSLGNLDSCEVHPREVFKPIIAISGKSAILIHTHPSHDPSPSDADLRTTRDLIRAGQLLRIEIIDHIIIAGENHLSLKSLGYFSL